MADSLHIAGARIWTADPRQPWAQSVTMRGGRITALDNPPESERIIDARGGVVLPGLIDTHLHLLMGGLSLSELNLSAIASRDEFESAVAEAHRRLAPGQWLIARGWSAESWENATPPDKSWLAAAGDRPVACYRMDQHAVLVNDAVLSMIETAADPSGGRIVRDAAGHPTGLLLEAAAWKLVNPIIPARSDAQQQVAVLEAQQHLHRLGVTAVGTMEHGSSIATAFEPVRNRLTLRCRVILLDRDWPLDFSFGENFVGDNHLAIIGYKAFVDGTLGSRTARMLADYSDDPGNRGLLVELARDATLSAWAHEVASRGFAPCIHAIGDEAANIARDAIADMDPSTRARIEHAQQIDPGAIERFRGLLLCMQPLHKADDGRYLEQRVGPKRLPGAFPFRSLLTAGARLAFGSDWPVVSCDPMPGIRAAVTGLTHDGKVLLPEQNLTVEEALFAYTRDAAHAIQLDDGGVIRRGGLADCVMLDRDPFAADWKQSPPRVIMTIAGGAVVYDAR